MARLQIRPCAQWLKRAVAMAQSLLVLLARCPVTANPPSGQGGCFVGVNACRVLLSPSDDVCIMAPKSVISSGVSTMSCVGGLLDIDWRRWWEPRVPARGPCGAAHPHTTMTAWHDRGATAGRSSGFRAQRVRVRAEGIISQVLNSERSGISYNVEAWAAATITSREREQRQNKGICTWGGVEAF